MRFHVISLFPEAVDAYLSSSILGRAREDKKLSVKYYNPRDFTKDKHRRIDRRPYGGGPGMVIEAEPYLRAVAKAKGKPARASHAGGKTRKVKTVFFSTDGKQFTNTMARAWAKKYDDVIFICGRYEGIDARVEKITRAEKISVGPFVLTGGEVPAMLVADAVARQIPGVLGTFESVEEVRGESGNTANPDVYTRPEVFVWKKRHYKVPKILLSGNHKLIEEWKSRRLSRGAPGTVSFRATTPNG